MVELTILQKVMLQKMVLWKIKIQRTAVWRVALIIQQKIMVELLTL